MVLTAAIFLENNARRAEEVRAVCPGITVQQVADNAVKRAAKDLPASVQLKPRETAQLRYKAGIGAVDIRAIKQWVADTASHTNRAALFDWGRTITQMKGVHARSTTAAEAEEALCILCGGRRRLATIRRLFNHLYNHHVKIIILTNNVRAKTKEYKLLVTTLLAHRPFEIIASGAAPSYSNKGVALTHKLAFRGVCSPTRLQGKDMQTRRHTRKHKHKATLS